MSYYYQAPDKSLHVLADNAFEHLLPTGSVEIAKAVYDTLSTPAMTPQQLAAQCSYSVDVFLNQGAASWGYTSLDSAAKFINSSNAQWKAEATALLAWMDTVWTAATPVLDDIGSGKKTMTVTDFENSLPVLGAKPTAK